jgi:hypothetical protein
MTEACRACPAQLLADAGTLLGASLNEVVPPEAQRHLILAQREFLLAVALTIEHNATRGTQPARTTRQRGAKSNKRRPARVDLE